MILPLVLNFIITFDWVKLGRTRAGLTIYFSQILNFLVQCWLSQSIQSHQRYKSDWLINTADKSIRSIWIILISLFTHDYLESDPCFPVRISVNLLTCTAISSERSLPQWVWIIQTIDLSILSMEIVIDRIHLISHLMIQWFSLNLNVNLNSWDFIITMIPKFLLSD
jgi:hypothetical protein